MKSRRIEPVSRTTLPKAGALIVLGLTLLCGGCGQQPASTRPPQVEVAGVVQRDVPIYGEWVATLDGYVNAQIQPHVSGYLVRQDYREGSFVRQGQMLFEIDPRPFRAALDMAKGQLAQAQAQLGNAALNVKRDVPEAQASAIPQSQLDTDRQAQLAAQAAVDEGQAAVEQAELNLGFTQVRSLIAGIAGIAQVQVGNLVGPSAVLTAVSQVDPIKALFPISADEYLRMADRINAYTVNLLSHTAAIPLQLILSNGSTFPQTGTILFADRQVDPQTGTIQIVASFPNPGGILRPGQYGKVRALTEVRKGALLIPQRSVTELQGADQVAVVGTDGRVAIRTVQVGERVGSMWIIEQGLTVGERVVAEGVDKVSDGMRVTPVAYHPNAGSD